MHRLWLPALAIVGLSMLRALLEAWAAAQLHDSARSCLSRWRQQIVSVLATRSPVDTNRTGAGAAASILAEQAEAILPWLTRYRSAMWKARVVPFLLLIPIAWFSWISALILLAAAPLIPVFMAIVGWKAKAVSEEQWQQLGSMNTFLLDRLRGLPTLRALRATNATGIRLRQVAEQLRTRTMRVLRIAFLSSAVLELFSALGVALLAVYVGFHLLGELTFGSWGQKLTLAEGLFILMLGPAFFEPLRELSAVWHDRAAGEAAVSQLRKLTDLGVSLPDAPGQLCPDIVDRAPDLCEKGPEIQISRLAFSFAQDKPLFQAFSLHVKPGEKIALVGSSGSGKTALLSLLAGLIEPDGGQLLCNGQLVTTQSVGQYRKRVGWMGQRAHVFAGSLQDNVLLGRRHLTSEQARQALHYAGLSSVLEERPGLRLGEMGVGLSGGENARLALARLIVDPQTDLWLVDEPTVHLDSDTATLIRQQLIRASGSRTLIVATHDPLLIALLDRSVELPDSAKANASNAEGEQ